MAWLAIAAVEVVVVQQQIRHLRSRLEYIEAVQLAVEMPTAVERPEYVVAILAMDHLAHRLFAVQ